MNKAEQEEIDDLAVTTKHGVSVAFYSNLPGPGQVAWIECMCGEEVSGQTSSWEDAGREMDLHLEGVRQAQ
jgi:hypothetical protein